MKPHPPSRTLIEKADHLWWRVVERETTTTGFSSDFTVVEKNFPRYGLARERFDELKTLVPQ